MKNISLLLIGFIGIHSLLAQDSNKLEEIIIQGNRLEIAYSESSRDIQVIGHQEISKLPVRSVNELLAYVGGVDIRQRAPYGGQADLSIDGGTFEQTLVLLNGIKLIDDQTAHIMMNIPVPIDAIDRIEILRGAAARIYGINALTGAINIVTKKESKSFLSARLYSGSSLRSKEEGDGSGIYGGAGIQLTGNYRDKKQNHLLAAGQDVFNGQRYNTALNKGQYFYNGNYRFNAQNSVQAIAGYIDNRFGANGFYAAPNDRESEEINKTSLFSLSSKHNFGDFTLMPRISNRYNKDDYRFYKHDLDQARSLHYTNALMTEINGNLSTSIGEFGVGWESRFSTISSSNIGRHSRNNHGFYMEYKGRYWDKILTSIGAYSNYNSDYGWQFFPGIDIAYLIDSAWKISANIGSAQRIPSFTDLYLDQAPGNVGNPEIAPENAYQLETGIEYSSPSLMAKAGYFYRNISDFIDWVRPDENQPYTPYNLGSNKVHGAYMRLEENLHLTEKDKLGYHFSYNYLGPQQDTSEYHRSKYVLESLKHQLIAGINYQHKNFSIQLKNRYIKRLQNTGYDILDLRINYRGNAYSFYMDVTNIFDTQYREVAAVPMPPRWFTIGINYRWDQR